jgi:disulfide bond formation protein DsbB
MLAPSQDNAATSATPLWRSNPPALAALIVAVVGAAAIAGAWFFELVIKLKPCPMCLEQRIPYYIGIPLAVVVALAAFRKAPRMLVVGGLVVLAGLMLWNTYMGVFHAGVEWKLWLGPAECTGTPEFGAAGGFLNRLQNINITRCDEAAWRFLGISLAGYNALISAALAVIALWGAKMAAMRSSER